MGIEYAWIIYVLKLNSFNAQHNFEFVEVLIDLIQHYLH